MPEMTRPEPRLYHIQDRVISAPAGRGEELRHHLASHGIKAKLNRLPGSTVEHLTVEEGTQQDIVQAILDEWER